MTDSAHQADTQPRRPPSPTAHIPWSIVLVVAAVAITAAVVVTSALALVFIANTRTVTVIVEGDAVQTRTDAVTVGELLARLGVIINPGDRLTPPAETTLRAETIIRVDRARTVFLQVNGDTLPWQTLLDNPADILAEAGIALAEADRVSIDGTDTTPDSLAAWPVPAENIVIRRAVAVRVQDDDDEERLIQTTALTVGEALFAAGITLFASDTVTPALDTPLNGDTAVSISRARSVTILADGASTQIRARGATVADALTEAGIALVGIDYTVPRTAIALRPGMVIRVIRVSETIEVVEEAIPFETVYQADPTLELDNVVTASAGEAGIVQRRTQVRMENGAVITRTPLEDIVARPATPRVIRYGTNVVVRTIDTPEGPRDYWRVLPMWATSYHPAALGGDNITSTGQILQKGIVGGDPRILPYGTQIFVAGYGIGEIADTGPPQRRRLWIDLGYSDADWVGWARTIDVYVLTPIPAEIDYLLMLP